MSHTRSGVLVPVAEILNVVSAGLASYSSFDGVVQENAAKIAAVFVGLSALYIPTYWAAWNGIWQTEDLGHGPIILALLGWLFWRSKEQLLGADIKPLPLAGYAFVSLGLIGYLLGRTLNISSVEFASHLPLLVGLLLLFRGASAIKLLWFPLAYVVFLVPLPSSFVDIITGPLKHWISVIVTELMSLVGYPVGRSGVIIFVGQYQLLVADACSGLHSMISLAALGTLFVYLMSRVSKTHNILMVISIIPIAFMANIFRVVILVLITYHIGDEAAQGFLHGFAGMVLMVMALILFFALDTFLALFVIPRPSKSDRSTSTS